MEALGMFLFLHCSRIWARFIFISGLGPPSTGEGRNEMSLIRSDRNLHGCVGNPASPFTANFIIIPNFRNILARASSLGPLMCFTFDHLLCPAHTAGHSCRVLAGVVLQGRLQTPDAGRKSRGCRARRAPSTAAGPAMPFTHRHTASNLHRRSRKLI